MPSLFNTLLRRILPEQGGKESTDEYSSCLLLRLLLPEQGGRRKSMVLPEMF
jgi:hypothetical protein